MSTVAPLRSHDISQKLFRMLISGALLFNAKRVVYHNPGTLYKLISRVYFLIKDYKILMIYHSFTTQNSGHV